MSKRGQSRQDYGTPRPFLDAVQRRFGEIVHDLAASHENAVHASYYTEKDDALSYPWALHWRGGRLLWLNPPFADIAPWAKKCAEESARGAKIAMLTPASIGSAWYREHVHGKAYVFGIAPRLTFAGEKDPYPKDLMLSLFTPEGYSGLEPWRWLDWKRPE